MAEIKQLKCPACGASLNISSDATGGACTYCGNTFVVELDHGEAVLRSSRQITGAIEAGTEQTLTELQRMQLVQQHGDLSQQYTALRIHQDTLDSELRTLQRTKQTRLIKTQIQELEVRRKEIRLHVKEVESDLKRIDAILNPHEVEEVVTSVPPPKRSIKLRRGCLWVFGLAIVLALLGTRINNSEAPSSTPIPIAVEQESTDPPSIPLDEPAPSVPTPEPPSEASLVSEPTAVREATATVNTNANVRNLPTTRGSEILGQVTEGETITLRMRNADSTWFGVSSSGGLNGWVSASLLTFDASEVDLLPVGSGTDAVGQ